MDKVEGRPVRWLWKDHLPFGTVSLIEGDPGLGKSQITMDLTSRITKGCPMPGEKEAHYPAGNVIVVNGEDALEFTIKPRLMAAGADLSRVIYRTSVMEAGKERPISMPEDIDLIAEDLTEQNVSLIIFDPFEAHLSGTVKTNDNHDIRRTLTPLARIAERTRAAVLLVRHLNKQAGGPAMYRGAGSIGIIGAARSALVVGRDENDPNTNILASVKSNLGSLPPAIRYKIVPATVSEHGNTIEVSRVEWLDTVEGVTANDLLSVPRKEEGKTDWNPVLDKIPFDGEGLTAAELHMLLPDYTFDGVRKALQRAEKSAYVFRLNDGKRGTPIRYLRRGLRPGEE